MVVSAAGLVLRALRYRLLLGRSVALWPLVLVTAVRNMAVDLVPARAGAAASYLYLVTARLGLPLEAGVASFALSFILDTLAVAPLLVVALLVVGDAPLSSTVLVVGSLAILVGSVAALWVLAPLLRLGASVAGRLPEPVRRLAPLLGAAAAEVEARERTHVLLPALGLSLLLRLAKYGAYYCLLQALLVSQGAIVGKLELPARLPLGGRCGGRRVAAAADRHEPRPLRGRRRRRPRLLARPAPGAGDLGRDGVPRAVAGARLRLGAPRVDLDHGGAPAARPGSCGRPTRPGVEARRDPCRRDGVTGGLPRRPSPRRAARRGGGREYLRPLRFDHWIKNLVVPVGSLLALAAQRSFGGWSDVGAILLAFIVSGLMSSVNYAVNEVLDAPFDASHPTKRERAHSVGADTGRAPAGPHGRGGAGRVRPVVVAPASPVLHGVGALFLAGLVYNLPPIRLKDRPYLDVVAEALTNPIRLAIGWHAVAATSPPAVLLLAVWTFGAFLMTGKRLAELRLLGDVAARYRPTFRAYSVPGLFVVQLAYAAAGLVALTWLALSMRPEVLPGLPLVAGLLIWAFRMTFEPDSPLIDPEHLYRRPVFLLVSVVVFTVLVTLAFGRRGAVKLRAHLGVFLVCLGLIALWTWPLARDPGHLVPDNTDPRLFSWVMISVFRNLLTRPSLLLHGSGFHPYGSSLTFAEPLVTPALLAGPLYELLGNPYLAYNLTLLLFWAASGWAMYAATYGITRCHPAAAAAMLVFTLAPPRIQYAVEFQMEIMFGLPLAVYAAGAIPRDAAGSISHRLARRLLAPGHRRLVLRGDPRLGAGRPRAVLRAPALVGLASADGVGGNRRAAGAGRGARARRMAVLRDARGARSPAGNRGCHRALGGRAQLRDDRWDLAEPARAHQPSATRPRSFRGSLRTGWPAWRWSGSGLPAGPRRRAGGPSAW